MRSVDERSGLGRVTRRLLTATMIVGLCHHIDHVLRVDHSGWPFRPDVNPFTYSLAAYPILLFALFGAARYFWVRWALLFAGMGFTLYAHSLIESPQMQYAMWAYNRSLEPALWNVRNLCGVQSETVGAIAVVVAMTLNILLMASVVSMFIDRMKGQSDPAASG